MKSRCYYFLQVAHSECTTCPVAVSIWSRQLSWQEREGHSGPWLLTWAVARQGQGGQSHLKATALPPPWLTSSPVVSRSDMELWGQLSSASWLCDAWWHLQQTSILPTLKQKIPTLLVAAKRNTTPHFWFLRASKYIHILWPIMY